MEREWRIIGAVEFTLDDICRIILPRSYIKRFKKNFPEYEGQIAFADDYSLTD